MRRLTTAWDQWFLMHSPLLWQLRLHWYLPLALLWCLLMFGGWIGWTAEPARWMGSPEGTVVATWNRPEDTTRQVGGIIAWIIAFGLALWWLWRVRIHNRWREIAPAPRLGLWCEYLWGALFFALLLAPTLLLDAAYRDRIQRLWQGQDTAAQQQAAWHVRRWELLLAPDNAARLVEWTQAAQAMQAAEPSTAAAEIHDNDKCNENQRYREYDPGCATNALQSLHWLAQADTDAIAQQLVHYGAALGRWGYAPVRPGASAQDQAQQLVSAYQAALQSPLAQEWRNSKAQHAGTAQPQDRARDARAAQSPRDGRDCDVAVSRDPRACFASDLARSPSQWRDNLHSALQQHLSPPPRLVQWAHPRYGMAQPGLVAHHLEGATPSQRAQERQRSSVLAAASAGFFAALALIAARLLSLRQIAALCGALTLAAPALMLLGVAGLANNIMLPLVPATLLALAWVRIALLRRPWGGSTLLGLGLALSLAGSASVWDEAARALELPDGSWPELLTGAPAVAVSTALLVAALSPLWRHWRALPER
ncbi:hypothetical protein LJR038_001515 [Acidovorax sp. LjRoot38]|uniref:hypothetical protein n=1 Tax=Acidovorax sp. LjRoot38 TaxID=3342327 RepID=UPI003ED0089B